MVRDVIASIALILGIGLIGALIIAFGNGNVVAIARCSLGFLACGGYLAYWLNYQDRS